MGHRPAVGLCGLLLVAVIGCGTEQTSVTDGGRPDAVAAVPENTAARCQDGIDNDNDGKTDCQDPDCWVLSFCLDAGSADATLDAPAPDVPAPDVPAPDAPPELGPLDAASDGPQTPDGPTGGDGPSADATPGSCNTHCDCLQGQFCYYGTCLSDPKMPVHCCAKTGCPPGRWCFETSGAKSTCAESTTHPCQDACDCGPAHCCKKDPNKPPTDPGHCVKDTADPWDPGGVVVGSLGECEQGTDATYCCADPLCHAGKYAYGLAADEFRCHDQQLGVARPFCSGPTCFGTACNCDPGESCVDVAAKNPVVGKSCGLFTGGSCVSNAVAEAIYGWSPSDLLPCCAKGCANGQKCEVGWRSDGEWAYARVEGVCGGSCANGICETGETAASCAEDCGLSCGDGKCFPEEITTCPGDCILGKQCGIPGELNVTWSKSTVCGDGVCQGGKGTCDWSEPESCRTCHQDCGACQWELIAGQTAILAETMSGVWGTSATDVFAVGGSCDLSGKCTSLVLHYDGTSWKAMASGTTEPLHGVWGSSGSDVFAVGGSGTIVHYNGTGWTPMTSGTPEPLHGVWGSSASDVFSTGESGIILHYDGTSWKAMASGTTVQLQGIWGSSANDVFAVGAGGAILHYDGTGWTPMTIGAPVDLSEVWGTSGNNVLAVGAEGTIAHYDGTTWTPMTSTTTEALKGVWGRSASDVFAVGGNCAPISSNCTSTIVHYDGTSWTIVTTNAAADLRGVWGTSGSDVFAVGGEPYRGTILRHDGTSWTLMTSGTTVAASDMWASSTDDVFTVGSGGTIMHYNGTSWTTMSASSYTEELYGVWGSSGNDVFAVGRSCMTPVFPDTCSGTIKHYDGTNWNLMGVPYGTTSELHGVWGNSGGDVFAVGHLYQPGFPLPQLSGVVLHYNGTSWTTMTGSVTGLPHGVWGSSASDVFTVGEYDLVGGGTVAHYDGTSWTTMTVPFGTASLHAVWGSSASSVFAVGQGGTILHYDGTGWKAMASDATVTLEAIWGSSASNIFVGGGGSILHYNGTNWSESTADLRHPISTSCVGLAPPGGTAAGEGLILGTGGVLLRHCPGGVCP